MRALGDGGSRGHSAHDLVSIGREEIAGFLSVEHGMPQIDWGAVETWIGRRNEEPAKHAGLRRAAAAAWLDEVRDALKEDHRRWRHEQVEGLGPMEGDAAIRIARGTDGAIATVTRALSRIRGPEPIPPIALVALATTESYYSFVSHFHPEEGEWGTSGGMYINDGPDSFPVIALPTNLKWALEQTIAHELTHHALRGVELPLWVEEGITQMMEERVTGVPNFKLDREMLERHRERWLESEMATFLSGEAFSSAEEDTQELAYHLSQLVVRGLLDKDAEKFFAFARGCRQGERESMEKELGTTAEEIVERALSRVR
jgi:hypothetical protein